MVLAHAPELTPEHLVWRTTEMLTFLLATAFALLAVAYASEISSTQYTGSDCTGIESTSTDTLDA